MLKFPKIIVGLITFFFENRFLAGKNMNFGFPHLILEIFPASNVSNIPDNFNESQLQNSSRFDFSYDRQQDWVKHHRNCNGLRQSPIALSTKNSIENQEARKLEIRRFNEKPMRVEIENNGHTVHVKLFFRKQGKARILGGPLIGSYLVEEIHWHWGENDEKGSEHVLDDKRYSAEMHIVAYNSKYGKKF